MVKSDLGNEITFNDIKNIKLYANLKDAKNRLNELKLDYNLFAEDNFKLYLNFRNGLLSQSDINACNAFGIGYINKDDLNKIKKDR